MLAIVFTGGEGPHCLNFEDYMASHYLKKFSSESPKVIAADSGALLALDFGYQPELLIGDMDSISERTLAFIQSRNIPIQNFSRDKDDSDTDLALKQAKEQGATPILLVGGGGGRLDHFAAIFRNLQRPEAPDVWLTGHDVIYKLPMKVGAHYDFTIEEGKEVSFFPLSTTPFTVKSEGLKWPLNEFALDSSFFSLSNRSESGHFSIETTDCALNEDIAQKKGNPVLLVIASLESLLFRV